MPTSKRHLPTIGSNHLSQTSATNINIADMPKPPSLTQTGKPNQQADSLIGKTIPGTISSTAKAYQPPLGHNSTQTKIKTRRFGRRNSKKWTWKRWLVVPTVIIIIIALGFVGWDIWQLDHKVNHLAVGNLTASVGGAENILVAGSTNRCNLTVQNAEWGFCSQGVTGVNSDIIFIVHIVPKTHAVSLLSIPRDTFVPNARAGDEAFKIDAALYEGPTQLVKAVEEDFGIPIQHYVEVGFDGFVNIVNAVGGIKMDFPMPVYDSESYLNIKTPGCQLLNGVQALQVVRARHLQYDPPGLDTSDKNLWPQEAESDIARIARTHEFLRVLASTIAAKGIGNPITDQKLIDAIAPQVQVDSGLSTSAMLQLAQEFHTVNINNVPQYTLPISTTTFSNYVYDGTAYGDVVFPVEATDQQVINEFLGTSNATDTMTGKPLPSPPAVTVKVVNGSGIPDQAAQTATALQALGFDVIGQPGSATPLSDEAVETVVSYASPSTEADAEAVARQLTGPVILSQNASLATSGSEVTVLTGTGLAVNAPANSSTPSTPNTSNSANTTTVTGLEPASSATLPLSAWDPRACTE
jgi:LCP family protein required for cell wall assembly